jgi:hypothetical protein
MTPNPILQELYAARAKIMAEYGNDLGRYLRDAAERLKASGRPIAKIEQRRIHRTNAAVSQELADESQSPPRNR